MNSRRAIPLFGAVLLSACPDGGGGGGDDEVGVTGDAGEESTTGDGGGDGDGDGEPTCPNSREGTYSPGQYDVTVEPVFTPSIDDFSVLNDICQSAEISFDGQDLNWATVNGDGVDLAVYRPSEDGEWPDGQFPLVFHHHGNGGQDGSLYEHIADAVVDDGAIFVSIAGDLGGTSPSRAIADICMLRWLFSAEDWDGVGPGIGGASRLDGNVIIMGHSNGGEGAHIVYNWFEEQPWAADLDAPEQDMRLCGVAGLAPRGAELANSPFSPDTEVGGLSTVPYLAFEGSLDNDVPGGSLRNSSQSGLDESPSGSDAANVLVWIYDAEHDSFGGGGNIFAFDTRGSAMGVLPEVQQARGEFIVGTWVDAFARRFLFGDVSVEARLYGDEPIPGLDEPSWWNYHPAFTGEPLVFTSARPHQSMASGEFGVREVVDTMVRGSSSFCTGTFFLAGEGESSENLPVTYSNWPIGTLRSDCAADLATYFDPGNGVYETFVIRPDYTAPPIDPLDPAERTIAWDVSGLDLGDASVFSLRASNIDAVLYPEPGMGCTALDGDSTDEAEFDIIFVSSGGVEVSVSSSDYARLLAPDIFEVSPAQGIALECPVSHFLESVRVPLTSLICPSFPLEELIEVRLEFDRNSGPPGRAVLLDTIEFQRDLSQASVCD